MRVGPGAAVLSRRWVDLGAWGGDGADLDADRASEGSGWLWFGVFPVKFEHRGGVGVEDCANQAAFGRAEGDAVRQAAVLADQRGPARVDHRVFLGRGGWLEDRFFVLSGFRCDGHGRWRRGFRAGDGLGVGEGLRHQVRGAMFGPVGAVETSIVGFAFFADGLDAEEEAERALGLAHHAGGLGVAFEDHAEFELGIACEALAVHGLFVAGDVLRGERGLGRVGGDHAGDLRDRGVVAAGLFFRGVVGGWREGIVERVHEVPIGISWEDEFEVERLGVDVGIHWRSMPLVMFTVKRYLLWRYVFTTKHTKTTKSYRRSI